MLLWASKFATAKKLSLALNWVTEHLRITFLLLAMVHEARTVAVGPSNIFIDVQKRCLLRLQAMFPT